MVREPDTAHQLPTPAIRNTRDTRAAEQIQKVYAAMIDLI